jgi:hypothetical protein
MRTVSFELKDSTGETHLYEVVLFPCDENARLQLKVGRPAFEMIAGIITTLAPALAGGAMEQMMRGAKLGEVAQSLTQIDWLKAPGAFVPLVDMIERNGGPELIAQIFARTKRQTKVKELAGVPSVTDAAPRDYVEDALKDASARDSAFGDGNMGEYWIAALMVLVVNFFPVGRDRPATWTDAVTRLTAGLLQP